MFNSMNSLHACSEFVEIYIRETVSLEYAREYFAHATITNL